MSDLIDYKAEVLKAYPSAIAKHWAYDNGHGYSSFWAISKEESIRYASDNDISILCHTAKSAWKSAYEILNISHLTKNGKK